MVDENNLMKIERLSDNLSQLIISFENRISNKRVIDRYSCRAKSSYYQLLINLENEVNILKGNTSIIPQQLLELKRKINSLLRLADETNSIGISDNFIVDSLQENTLFETI